MRRSIALLSAALAFGAGHAAERADTAVRIDMRPVVDATSDHVVLGDLATIHAQDLATIRRLAELPLGNRPTAGTETAVRRDTLARWVQSRLGIARRDVEWGGALETIVRTPAQERHAQQAIDSRSVPVGFTLAAPTEYPRAASPAVPLIVRGEWVQLRMKAGGVELEARVQALQDGAAGQLVRVRAPAAAAAVAARVIARGHVEAEQ